MPEGLQIYTDRKIYSIPDGLNELMYDISKEVREAVKVAVPLIEKGFESAKSQINFLNKYNLSKEQGDRFATVIQAAFRGYQTRKKLLNIAEDLELDEQVCSMSDDSTHYQDPMFDALRTRGVSAKHSITAATKIQAFYRGYKLRKQEKERGQECLVHGVPSHESWRHDWLTDSLTKKSLAQDELPWRKSFLDFYKNFNRKYEGDRLHIETIFGGKYEDYNWVCDQTSCQEFRLPTAHELKELAKPGEIESSLSEGQGLPGSDLMQDMLNARVKDTQVSYEEAEREKQFFKQITETKTDTIKEISTEKIVEKVVSGQQLPAKEESKSRLSKSRKSDVSLKSEGSKSRISKKSKLGELVESTAVPELSVKSLSEAAVSTTSEASGYDAADSAVSEVSAEEEKASKGSKKSEGSLKGSVSETGKTNQGSKGSRTSAGSRSLKSSSKQSITETETAEGEQTQE